MKNNRPRVFGNCAAGCKWEVPHKGDFLSFKHSIPASVWLSENSQYKHSLTIDRLVDEDVVIVDVPFVACSEYGVVAEQEGSTITFIAGSKPLEDIEVSIAVFPSTAVIEI